jgi:hypothetical protein
MRAVSEGRLEEYQEAFSRIEREVEGGRTDLGGLGFWRLVGRVKVEPRLAEHWADQIGRIDQEAFRRRVRFQVPVWVGNALLLTASAVLIAAIPWSVAVARGDPESVWAGLLVVVAAGGLAGSLHDPAHWAVGRLAGIRFTDYYLDGPLRIQPGLKIDYASYLRASPGGRAWMHAAGAIASKVAPFAVFAAVYLPHRAAGYDLFPSWSLWAILAFGVFQLITDLTFSVRKSDWKKVRRELRVGRVQRAERM